MFNRSFIEGKFAPREISRMGLILNARFAKKVFPRPHENEGYPYVPPSSMKDGFPGTFNPNEAS